MSARPQRLPFAATPVLKAVSVQVVPSGHKMTWLEIYALDHSPEGVYLGAAALGERVGLGRDAVEIQRRELTDWGLLVRLHTGWCPVVPSDCIPATRKPSPDEIKQLAQRLERHIIACKQRLARGDASDASPEPSHADHRETQSYPDTPIPPQDARGEGVLEYGGSEEDRDKPPTSPPPHIGGVAHAKMRQEPQERIEIPKSGDEKLDQLLQGVAFEPPTKPSSDGNGARGS